MPILPLQDYPASHVNAEALYQLAVNALAIEEMQIEDLLAIKIHAEGGEVYDGADSLALVMDRLAKALENAKRAKRRNQYFRRS